VDALAPAAVPIPAADSGDDDEDDNEDDDSSSEDEDPERVASESEDERGAPDIDTAEGSREAANPREQRPALQIGVKVKFVATRLEAWKRKVQYIAIKQLTCDHVYGEVVKKRGVGR
jgi:hypothetical protein